MDNIHKRTAQIAVSETDTTTHNRTIVINLSGIVPNVILFRSDIDLTHINFMEKVDVTVDANNDNVLYDPTDPTRFKLVTIVVSPITFNSAHVYYDSRYKDMFVIPSLLSVGTGTTVELYKDKGTTISGYRLLGQGNQNQYSVETTLPMVTDKDDSMNFALSTPPNRVTTNSSYLFRIGGIQPNTNFHLISKTYPNNDVAYSNVRMPVIFVDLGNNDVVFPTKQQLPTFNMLDNGLNTTVLDYAGFIESDKLIIPLNF